MELTAKHLLSLILNGSTSEVETFTEKVGTAIVAQVNTRSEQDRIIRALDASGFKHTDQYQELINARDDSDTIVNFLIALRRRAFKALKELRE